MLREEIWKAEKALYWDQNFGDLDGVQSGAFAQVVRHDPLDTIHRDIISVCNSLHATISK